MVHKRRGYDRTARGDLCKAIAHFLLTDMTDDRFRLVTVISVNVSCDFPQKYRQCIAG